jgi:hypothetical protein
MSSYLADIKEQQKADLADSIKFAVESENPKESSTTKTLTETSTVPNTVPQIMQNDIENSTSTAAPIHNATVNSTTSDPLGLAGQTFQVIQVPANGNLFTGLAQNVGTLNLGGVIMEAFKLAQVSIALFAQQLAGSLASTTVAIVNSSQTVRQ